MITTILVFIAGCFMGALCSIRTQRIEPSSTEGYLLGKAGLQAASRDPQSMKVVDIRRDPSSGQYLMFLRDEDMELVLRTVQVEYMGALRFDLKKETP